MKQTSSCESVGAVTEMKQNTFKVVQSKEMLDVSDSIVDGNY